MAEGTITVRAGNPDILTRRYYDSLVVETRLVDAAEPDIGITFLGRKLNTPILTAAMSRLNGVIENGFRDLAEGAKTAGSVAWIGIGEEKELESMAATGANTIKIIKPYQSHELVFQQIEHGKKCGVIAVGMDIDHCFAADGTYPATRENDMCRPVSMADMNEFVQAAGDTPFIAKGVLSVADAVKCAEAGAGAIVLSHHHGIMDFMVPPIMLLPEIAKEIGGCIPIIVDSNITTGHDAFKALALGATAVCVGRPLLAALKKEGAEGVSGYIDTMNKALKQMMARTGSPDPAHIDPGVIHHL